MAPEVLTRSSGEGDLLMILSLYPLSFSFIRTPVPEAGNPIPEEKD
jgi:hypothetical protein